MFVSNFARFSAITNQFIRQNVSVCQRENGTILLKTDFSNIVNKRACSQSSKTDNVSSKDNNNSLEKSNSEPSISRRMQRRLSKKIEDESNKDLTSESSQTVIQTQSGGRRLRIRVSNQSADSPRVKELQSVMDTMSAREISEENLDFPSDFENFNKLKREQSRKAYRPNVNPALTSILLFPGQGSQYVGMGKRLLPYHGVQEMYNKASAILGYDLLNLCLNGPQTELNRTVVCQPAVMVTSLAALEVLKATDPEALEQVVGTAGFSVGEYAALVSADVFSFEDAVEMVKVRAEAMQKLTEELASGMMTVFCNHQTKLSFAMEAAREHCKRNLQIVDPVCQIANYLCTDVKVIAGNIEALKFIEENKSEFGIRRLKWLPVSGAFHTPLMKEAGKKLNQVLMKMNLREPKVPVHSNVHGGRDGPRLRQHGSISMLTGVDFGEDDMIQRTREEVTTSLISCLENRFSDAHDGVIGACKIADFRIWPAASQDSSDFGDDGVAILVEQFQPVLVNAGVDADAVELEWDILKRLVYSKYKDTEQIRKCLSQQVYKAVKWEQILHILFSREKGENFPRVFEFGPSNQLGLLLKQTNAQAFNSYKNIEA